ncbi:hypothetical protein B7486_47525 [cyanobacterium TDX16]|nr:hypothetical protein B7486_47525 [cyanobacterium TDX16]
MDDSAGNRSRQSTERDRKLYSVGGNVLPSLSPTPTGQPAAVGDRLDSREPALSRTTDLSLGNNISSTSHSRSSSSGDRRAYQLRGMVATDGSWNERRLDITADLDTTGEEMKDMAEEHTTQSPKQVPYIPASKAAPGNTLVPVNMQAGIAKALSRLEKQVGVIDEYVTERLNYGSVERLHQYFNAEQVDAIALAINNLEKGRACILGDQTGVGKGRVVAAAIRYARETGRIPIFVTKDPVLYADLYRDLSDIRMGGFRAFPTNSNLKISLPDGRELKTSGDSHEREKACISRSGDLGNYQAVFTTYSQMQSVKGKETERRNFLRAIAPRSIVILDESHEAGGSGEKKPDTVPDRAKFVRELLSLSQGGFYSSATFAKRPNVMDLYALTDMGKAVSTEKLVGLVERGGIPMQQGLATMLTQAGQYIRRERSYEGVSFDAKIAPVDKQVVENMSSIMAAILEFDLIKQQYIKTLDKELKAQAKSLSLDNATGSAGVDSTNFTSIMHNLVEQSLLALKAEATVQQALQALRNNEKPVIALSSTMGSSIGDHARTHHLKPGNPIDLSFGDLLNRYLERTRDILVKDFAGSQTRHRLADEELGAEGTAQYEAVLDLIDETDLSSIPISPIDYIKARLTQEGYQVSEVTGRIDIVDYDCTGRATYSQRSPSKAADRNNIEAFNAGQIDVMILNRSGATGISLHASERFADRRKRHMIIVQPEKDINQFMQMLGRIHRTGQVTLPKFTVLMADIPAEKRPNAVLLKKMASLNANTTAARKSGINLNDLPDFLNDYGDQVVAEIVSNNPSLNRKLGYPLKTDGEELSPENAIARVTGRITLLPLAAQEAFYNQLEREYQELVERQEAIGESILEASTLDLDARTTARMEVIPADPGSDSPFASAVYLEVVDAKSSRQPLTTLEVANACCHSLELKSITQATDDELDKIGREGKAQAAIAINSLRHQVEEYRRTVTSEISSSATQKINQKLDRQLSHIQRILQDYPVGERVRVVTANQNLFYGVVGKIWETASTSGNPAVPANWKMQILVADQARELTLPLSKVNTIKENAISIAPQAKEMLTGRDIYHLFDLRQTQQRQERQIFTGNILRAYEAFQGKLVNFTDIQGKIRQGVLTSQEFDIEQAIESHPVRIPTAADAMKFITEVTHRTGSVKTSDELLTIKAERRGDGYILQTPKTKDLGGRYYLDPDLLSATGADFYSVGDRMECIVPAERIDVVLETIVQQKGLSLAVFDQPALAREMLGIELPKLEPLESSQLEILEVIATNEVDVEQINRENLAIGIESNSLLGSEQLVVTELPVTHVSTVNSNSNFHPPNEDFTRSQDAIAADETAQIHLPVQQNLEQIQSNSQELQSSSANPVELESKNSLSNSETFQQLKIFERLPTETVTPTTVTQNSIIPNDNNSPINLENKNVTGIAEDITNLSTSRLPDTQSVDAENASDRLTTPMQIFQQVVDRVDPSTGNFLATVESSNPSLETLRSWYRAARELGKSEQYLNRIAEVANEYKQGKSLEERAIAAMQTDLSIHSRRLKMIEELNQLSDRDFQKQWHNVKNYFQSAPKSPDPIQKESINSEVGIILQQLNNLELQKQEQMRAAEKIKNNPLHHFSKNYSHALETTAITLNKISNLINRKEQKEAQLRQLERQAETYQAWIKTPLTTKMRSLAEVLQLPPMQKRIDRLQQVQSRQDKQISSTPKSKRQQEGLTL